MEDYTKKFFFKEIRNILDESPVEETNPFFLYRDSFGCIIAMHSSGNKIICDDFGEIHYLLKKWMKEEEAVNGN